MEYRNAERLNLLPFATPLEPMTRLTRALGGPALYIKRDDCTGVALGGNKTRKLEFLMADARRLGADHVITHGAVQSNHVRQTAAVAAALGMKCTALLEHRVPHPSAEYLESGNAFLTRLVGARVRHYPANTNMDEAMADLAAGLRARGENPYVIPGGGSNELGALGYVRCAQELSRQCEELRLRADWIVHATGSGGTQAGLVAGLRAMRSDTRVLGVSVKSERSVQEERVYRIACAAAGCLAESSEIDRRSVVVNSDFVGGGYGLPTSEMSEAVQLVARLEGIVLDPVYTGKAMAGLIHLTRSGDFDARATVVFLHTGGAPSLFSYRDSFAAIGEAADAEAASI